MWGLLHGIANVITRAVDKKTGWFSQNKNKVLKVFLWLMTFIFVNLAWVIFRADSLAQAGEFYQQFLNFNEFSSGKRLLQEMYTGGFELIGKIIPAFDVIMPICLFVFAFIASVFLRTPTKGCWLSDRLIRKSC